MGIGIGIDRAIATDPLHRSSVLALAFGSLAFAFGPLAFAFGPRPAKPLQKSCTPR